MRKYIKILFSLLISLNGYAQSEMPLDSLTTPTIQYKQYGDFILDMNLFSIMPPILPKVSLEMTKPIVNYNDLLQLDKMPIYSSFYSMPLHSLAYRAFYTTSNPQVKLQSKTFKINENLRFNTFGQYDESGRRITNPKGMPWQKNNFMGGFEIKSNKGFGLRIEVRKESNNPYIPF